MTKEATLLSWFTTRTKKQDPAWVRFLGFAAGGALATIATIIIRHTVGMGDDTYRLMLTIGPMFIVVGLVASAIAYASRPSTSE